MSTLITGRSPAKPKHCRPNQLTSADDMHAALKYIQPGGYSGSVSVDATGTWTMAFSSTSQNAQSYMGKINDYVIIENNTLASVCPAAKFGNLYVVS